MSQYPIHSKRIYEDSSGGDGYRVLVDRLWPRGVSKEDAGIDEWLKEIAPSTELRKWFNHESAKFDEFKKRYRTELANKKELIEYLAEKSNKQPVTLLYAARDQDHNHANVLRNFLVEEIGE
jgi:uncharacterized protein YeaO (DUF488 family)